MLRVARRRDSGHHPGRLPPHEHVHHDHHGAEQHPISSTVSGVNKTVTATANKTVWEVTNLLEKP